jgi:hypothetical protein
VPQGSCDWRFGEQEILAVEMEQLVAVLDALVAAAPPRLALEVHERKAQVHLGDAVVIALVGGKGHLPLELAPGGERAIPLGVDVPVLGDVAESLHHGDVELILDRDDPIEGGEHRGGRRRRAILRVVLSVGHDQ